MTEIVIDGIIKDWGERLFYPPVKGRKGKKIPNPVFTRNKDPNSDIRTVIRNKLALTVRKTPEVMVKISGGGKNMTRIKAHINYISRKGELELEDERGNIHLGRDGIQDVCDAWAKGKIGIPSHGEKRKEAFNIILSMPPGTNRQAVKDAARAFAANEFSNHQYVFAAHNDESHPHVHLTVKATGHNGKRLNPRKADLQLWREQFAEQLRALGIEANATPRRVRGIVKKAEKQAVRHINQEFEQGKRNAPARVTVAQQQAAEQEAINNIKHINPAQDKINGIRTDMQMAYGQIARVLASGNIKDKKLALEIVNFVKQMPQPIIKHQALVKELSRIGITNIVDLESDKNKLTKLKHERVHINSEKDR